MRLRQIIDRITDQCPGFAQVGHALTSRADLGYPAALVTPVSVAAGPSQMLGMHSQMLAMRFGVFVLMTRVQDGDTDYGTADLFDDLCAELRAALTKWTPDAGLFKPMDFVGGQLAQYAPGIACWREDYATTFELRI